MKKVKGKISELNLCLMKALAVSDLVVLL